MPWFSLKRKDSAPVYKKGHLGMKNQMEYVEGKGWILKGEDAPESASSLPPPPKSSKTGLSSTPGAPSGDSDADSSSGLPGAGRGRGRGAGGLASASSLTSRYAKPPGSAAAAASSGSSVLLPRAGSVVGRGRGRGTGIRTFVPGASTTTSTDSPVAQKATVFNPYAVHTATTATADSQPDNSDNPPNADGASTSGPDLQSAATPYPSSPFANAIPPSSSSVALSTASEVDETAESAQQGMEEVLAPAVSGVAEEKATEESASQDTLAGFLSTAPQEGQGILDHPNAPELAQQEVQEGLLDPEGVIAEEAPTDDFFGAGAVSQGLDDFGGNDEDPEGTPQEALLDPESTLEPSLTQDTAEGLHQLNATSTEGAGDEEEMERRAGEAASVLYGGTMDWNSIMGWGQAQKEAGYPEEQVADWLAQYGVDMDVYHYWLAKYYDAAWYAWYQDSYLPSLTNLESDATAQEAVPVADDSEQQPTTSANDEMLDPQTQPEFQSQASNAVSTLAEQGSMFPDTDVLGGDSSFPEQTAAEAAAEQPDSDIQLDSAAAADSAESSQAASTEEPAGASGNYPLMFSLGGESEQPHELPDQAGDESTAFTGMSNHEADQGAAATEVNDDGAVVPLDQEDSFYEDQAASHAPVKTPTKEAGGLSSMTWSNPAFDLLQSPEQPAAAASPASSPHPHQDADAKEDILLDSNMAAGSNSNGNGVQHVESLGQWLPKQDPATRRTSAKLSGPLPWDDLSSSEDEFSPRPRHKKASGDGEPLENGDSPEGHARAPPPDSPAQGKAASKGMSIHDQIAFGARTVQDVVQGAGGVLDRMKGFALPQASPTHLYRTTPELDDIYGPDDALNEPSEHSEEEDEIVPKAVRKLDMGSEAHPQAPPHPPSSAHADAQQEEVEDELASVSSPVKKRTGEEEVARHDSPVEPVTAESEEAPAEALSDGEGWEGFGDEDTPQKLPQALHPKTESPRKAVNSAAAQTSVPDSQANDTISNDIPEAAAVVEEEEEGWGGFDDSIIPGDSKDPKSMADGDDDPAGVPEVEHSNDPVPEIEPVEEEEGGWEGLDEDLILPSNEDLQLAEVQAAEETPVAEEPQASGAKSPELTQAAAVADSEADAFEGFQPATSEREALLEAQLSALREQLGSQDSQLAELKQQAEHSRGSEAELDSLRGQLDHAQSSAERSAETETALRQEASQWQQAHTEALEQLTTTKAALAERDIEFDNTTQQLESLRKDLNPLRAELESAQDQLAEFETRNDSLSSEYDAMSEQLESLTRQLSSEAKKTQEREQQLQDLTASLKQAESERARAQEQLAVKTNSCQELTQQLEDLTQQLQESKDTHASSTTEQASLTQQLQKLTQQLEESRASYASISSERDSLTQQLTQHASEYKAAQSGTTSEHSSLTQQVADLTQQLRESQDAHARSLSEHELLTQQLSGQGLSAERVPDSPTGSPSRKLRAALEELTDLRGKFEGAEGHILELQEQVDQLQAAVATAQEAVQEHLAMREKQTDRIKKAKNAGPKSLPVVTAEREEAILRADRAEHQMHLLADQRNTLLQQLEAAQSAPAGHFTTGGPASTASSESALPNNTSTAGFGPAPESVSEDTADLTAQVAELTEQLEGMKNRHSLLEADLQAAQNELADQESSTAQVAELTSELASATQRGDSLAAERDAAQTRLDAEVARALGGDTELAQLRKEQAHLTERVQTLEQEAQEQYDAFTAKEEECDRVEAQLLTAQQALEEAKHASSAQASSTQELEAMTAQLATVSQQLDSAQQSHSALEDELQAAQDSLESSRQQLQDSESRSQAIQQAADAAAEEAEQAGVSHQQELQQLQEQVQQQLQGAKDTGVQLQEQLQESSDAAEQLRQQLSNSETSTHEAQEALTAAQSRLGQLERDLEAAVATRDEFVYHLSPHKQRPLLPPGSPAPKADKDQLRAALKAARAHAAEMEEQAQEETVGAEEAYLLLGDAEVTIAVLSDVLEDSGMDMDAILDAQLGGDGSYEGEDEQAGTSEQEPDNARQHDEGPDVEGWLHGSDEGFSSPTRTTEHEIHSAQPSQQGEIEEEPRVQEATSPVVKQPIPFSSLFSIVQNDPDPAQSVGLEQIEEEPLLQEAVSPVVKSIPFMQTIAASAQGNELSLEGWGAGPFAGQQTAEGWGDDDDLSWLQNEGTA